MRAGGSAQEAISLDDEAIQRPLYKTIQPWLPVDHSTEKRPTVLHRTPFESQSPSSSDSRLTYDHQDCTESAYQRFPTLPVKPKVAPEPYAETPVLCRGRATPTAVCGVYSPSLNDPPIKAMGRGGVKCPRCNAGFSRKDSLRRHFPICIALNGNPDALAWTDDDTYPELSSNPSRQSKLRAAKIGKKVTSKASLARPVPDAKLKRKRKSADDDDDDDEEYTPQVGKR